MFLKAWFDEVMPYKASHTTTIIDIVKIKFV